MLASFMVISSLIISLFDMLGKAFSHYRFNCGNYPELKTELLFLYDLYIIKPCTLTYKARKSLLVYNDLGVTLDIWTSHTNLWHKISFHCFWLVLFGFGLGQIIESLTQEYWFSLVAAVLFWNAFEEGGGQLQKGNGKIKLY